MEQIITLAGGPQKDGYGDWAGDWFTILNPGPAQNASYLVIPCDDHEEKAREVLARFGAL